MAAMRAEIYEYLPQCAKEIRQNVFIEEQGFQNELDEVDNIAVHIVLFDEADRAVATCRVFLDDAMDSYILGRLAVARECRGKDIGSAVVQEAERYVRKKGGSRILLHAQCRVSPFYQKAGYTEFGEIGDDEGCPHIWMKKDI